jgi:hypothetical protein
MLHASRGPPWLKIETEKENTFLLRRTARVIRFGAVIGRDTKIGSDESEEFKRNVWTIAQLMSGARPGQRGPPVRI